MLSTVEALEQITLQMPAVDRFLNHFFLFLVPHRIVQHFLQHPQRPQLSGTYIAQKGAVVTAVSPPVFLLPAGISWSAVDELVQLFRIVYMRRKIRSRWETIWGAPDSSKLSQ